MIYYNDYPEVIDYGTHFTIPYNIKKTEFGYEAETIEAKAINKEKITKSLIKSRYGLDDEIAIINNKDSGEAKYLVEYEEYQQFRADCKALALSIITSL